MEVKKFHPFVVKPKTKTSPLVRPLVPQPLPKSKTKHKPRTKFEARGLSLENKKKLNNTYAKCFVKTSRK